MMIVNQMDKHEKRNCCIDMCTKGDIYMVVSSQLVIS